MMPLLPWALVNGMSLYLSHPSLHPHIYDVHWNSYGVSHLLIFPLILSPGNLSKCSQEPLRVCLESLMGGGRRVASFWQVCETSTEDGLTLPDTMLRLSLSRGGATAFD